MSAVKKYHAALISRLLAHLQTSVVLFSSHWVKLVSSSAQRGQRLTWGLRLGRNHRQPFRGGRKRARDLRIPLKLLPANCQSTQIQSVSHSARCVDRKLCQSDFLKETRSITHHSLLLFNFLADFSTSRISVLLLPPCFHLQLFLPLLCSITTSHRSPGQRESGAHYLCALRDTVHFRSQERQQSAAEFAKVRGSRRQSLDWKQ